MVNAQVHPCNPRVTCRAQRDERCLFHAQDIHPFPSPSSPFFCLERPSNTVLTAKLVTSVSAGRGTSQTVLSSADGSDALEGTCACASWVWLSRIWQSYCMFVVQTDPLTGCKLDESALFPLQPIPHYSPSLLDVVSSCSGCRTALRHPCHCLWQRVGITEGPTDSRGVLTSTNIDVSLDMPARIFHSLRNEYWGIKSQQRRSGSQSLLKKTGESKRHVRVDESTAVPMRRAAEPRGSLEDWRRRIGVAECWERDEVCQEALPVGGSRSDPGSRHSVKMRWATGCPSVAHTGSLGQPVKGGLNLAAFGRAWSLKVGWD